MKTAIPVGHTFLDRPRKPFSRSLEKPDSPKHFEPYCPQCHGGLDLHQPDPNRSDALLGVCTACPAWYLIDGNSGTLTDIGLSDRLCTLSLLVITD